MNTNASRAARAIAGRKSATQAQATFERRTLKPRGLTLAQYDAMFAGQFRACACCSADMIPGYAQAVQYRRQHGPREGAARILVLRDRLFLVCGPCLQAAMALNRDASLAEKMRDLLTGAD